MFVCLALALTADVDVFIKKLICRRDSARRCSSRHSRSFKVTYFETNQLPLCEFISVNNITLHHISQCFQLSRSICQIIAFDKVTLLIYASVLSNLFEYRHKPTAKNYIFCATFLLQKSTDRALNNFTSLALKANSFSIITQSDGHAYQDHSKSPILVPIESSYATF